MLDDKDIYKGELLPWTSKTRDFQLLTGDITDFMEENLKKISLARAIVFLKKVKNGRSLFPIESYPSDASVFSNPVSSNPNKFDRYQMYFDANNNLTLDVFEYRYTLYNNIDIKGGIVPAPLEPGGFSLTNPTIDKTFISKDLYVIFYKEKMLAGIDFLSKLRNLYPQDYYYNMGIDNDTRIIARFSNTFPLSTELLNNYKQEIPKILDKSFFISSALRLY
jgi:hypothetical protein